MTAIRIPFTEGWNWKANWVISWSECVSVNEAIC